MIYKKRNFRNLHIQTPITTKEKKGFWNKFPSYASLIIALSAFLFTLHQSKKGKETFKDLITEIKTIQKIDSSQLIASRNLIEEIETIQDIDSNQLLNSDRQRFLTKLSIDKVKENQRANIVLTQNYIPDVSYDSKLKKINYENPNIPLQNVGRNIATNLSYNQYIIINDTVIIYKATNDEIWFEPNQSIYNSQVISVEYYEPINSMYVLSFISYFDITYNEQFINKYYYTIRKINNEYKVFKSSIKDITVIETKLKLYFKYHKVRQINNSNIYLGGA